MGVMEDTEKVLKKLHMLISKGEPAEGGRVIIDKEQAQMLLDDLNKCFYDMGEEYHISSVGQSLAEKNLRKQGDKIIEESKKKAEDIYAASIIYSNDSIKQVYAILKEATESATRLYSDIEDKMKEQEKELKKNQEELRAQLYGLADSKEYEHIIEKHRLEEKKEQRIAQGIIHKETASRYANRQAEIRVNKELISRLGMKPVDDVEDLENLIDDREVVKPEEETISNKASGETSTDKDSFAKESSAKESSGKDFSVREASENKENYVTERKISDKKETDARENGTKQPDLKKPELKKNEEKKSSVKSEKTKSDKMKSDKAEKSDKSKKKNTGNGTEKTAVKKQDKSLEEKLLDEAADDMETIDIDAEYSKMKEEQQKLMERKAAKKESE